MVLIPAGEFRMGSPDSQGYPGAGEDPRHRVALGAYYLDEYQVTNRLFLQFVEQTGFQTTAEREGCAWVADWYDPDNHSKSPSRNPTGPSSGEYRVVRGRAGSMIRTSYDLNVGSGLHPRIGATLSGSAVPKMYNNLNPFGPGTVYPDLSFCEINETSGCIHTLGKN